MIKTLFSLSGLTVVGYLITLIGQMIISRTLGTSREVDLFFYSFTLISMFSFFSGPVAEAATPQLFGTKENGKDEESRYYSKVLNTIMLLGILMSILLYLFLEYLPGFLIEESLRSDTEEIKKYSFLLMPMIFLTMLSNFNQSALNAYSKFIFQQITKAIGSIAGLIVLWLFLKDYGIYAMIFYSIISLVILCIGQLIDFKKLELKYQFSAGFITNSRFYKVFITLSGTFFLFSVYLVYEKWVLAQMGTGMVSAYSYAQRLSLVPQQIFLFSILSVAWTRILSKLKDFSQVEAVRDALHISAVSFGFSFFLALGLSVYAREILYLIFYGGAFNLKSLEETTKIFQLLILALPFIVLYGILSRIITSQQKAKLLGFFGLLHSLCLFTGAALAQYLGRVELLAIGSVLTFVILSFAMIYYLRSEYGHSTFRFFISKSYLLIAYSLFCFVINLAIKQRIAPIAGHFELILILASVFLVFSIPIGIYFRKIIQTMGLEKKAISNSNNE